MSEIKIVFTGSMGAGKTTAISSISNMRVVSTDVPYVDAVDQALLNDSKTTTTVAMDYGEIDLDTGETVKLYGTPGQKRFSYMWEILSRGALGIIILVDSRRTDPLQDLVMFMDNFKPFIQCSTVVVGITHIDVGSESCMELLTDYFCSERLCFPLLPVDTRKPVEVKVLVEALVALLQVKEPQ
jgi:uncharacterized protein